MIRRALTALLCWLLLWQPAMAACTLEGSVSKNQTTYSLAVPTRSLDPITTGSSNDLIVLYASLNAQGVNSGGLPPSLTAITNGGLSWARRFRETQVVPNCYGASTCYFDVELWWAVAPSPLAAQVFDVTFDTGLAFANIFVFAYSGLADPFSPWDTDLSLPAKGTNYTGSPGTPTAKQVTGASTANGNDILLYSCFMNGVTTNSGFSCDFGAATSGQSWVGVTTGYLQNIFTGFYDNSSIWVQPVGSPISGATLTAQDQTQLTSDWIAHADAVICSTGAAPVFPQVWINE